MQRGESGGRERERQREHPWGLASYFWTAAQPTREEGGLSSPCDFLWLLLLPIAVTDYPPQDCLVTEVLEKEKGRKNPEDFHIAFEDQEYLFPTLKQEPIGFLSVCITVLTSGFCSLLAVVSSSKGIPEKKADKLTTDSMILWILVKLLFTKSSNMCLCILSRFHSYIQWEESHEACLFYLNWNLNLFFNFILFLIM